MGSANAAEYVGVHQYGVAYPGGVEAPIHTVCEMRDCEQLQALVSLDWCNVFNLIDQVHMAHQIVEHAPGLARLYEWLYCEDSILVLPPGFEQAGLLASILSQVGVRQGDILGPLFFSIRAAHILDALAALPTVRTWAYLNDILIAIPTRLTKTVVKAAIVAAFATAEREGGITGL